jgi:HK97 family phage portal protein|nr:MAG TPA_asm: HK97 Family Phage Portal Protein [Caudoviricetes sp.]
MLFRKLEQRSEKVDTSDLKNPNKWLINLIGGNETYSGENVDTSTAINIAAVYACIRILSNHVAMLPLQLYQETRNKKKRIHDHQIAKLIETRPNPYMTPFQFKQTMEAHRQLYGNAFAEIEWSKTGYPKALWILNPLVTKVVMEKDNEGNLKRYLVQTTLVNGKIVYLPYSSVLHIKGLSTDGIIGKSPIEVARETIGIQIAGQKFTGKFYANGTMSSGVLKVPQSLKPEAKAIIRKEWEKFNNGLDNSHRVAILDAGLDYQSLGIKQCDAQYIETQKFSIAEIARIFNVPPHMLADLERATFSNIEQQSLEFVRDTLSPLLISWEQELQYQLFTEEEIEKQKYYFKFNLNSLLRGDSTNRAAYYEKMINLGIYSINEVRELEDKDKIKNGDKHYMSLNYIDIDLMNEYQKQKVKIKENPVEDKPPNEDDDPKENIDENNEGGGKDEQTDQGN